MKPLTFKQLCTILSLMILQTACISASSYGPGLLFHKPYCADPYHASYYMSCAAGSTQHAYNKTGNVVPYLQEYGHEDFLKRFIDPTLPPTDSQALGVIDFLGTFHFQQLNIAAVKNIHHNLFLGIGTSIRNLSISSINANLQLDPDVVLTPTEELYLEGFLNKIPTRIDKSGIFGNHIECGYNKKWNNFHSIDSLQLFLQATISSPQIMTGHNIATLQYPIGGNISFSYPLTAILNVCILNHVTLGMHAAIIPIQKCNLNMPVNRSNSNNEILLTETTRCLVNPGNVFSTNIYIDIRDFLSKCTATIGYGYAHGAAWDIQAFNEQQFPHDTINSTKLFSPWSISSIFIQFYYNFASENNPHAPLFSLFYVVPINGILYPKMNVAGGTYYLSVNYPF